MLQPKRVKYRNKHRGRRKGIAVAGSGMNFGAFGLKATESAWVSSRQIEAARRVITRYARKGGKIWIRIFPDKSVSARPAETRMGGGKGAVDHWVAVVLPGRMLFEVSGIPESDAREALKLASNKLPMDCRVVSAHE
ncbi:MAG: 50S ribosomal protein L16 [SAR202 cluster bacterium]|nr:50S ribosomal protein L16 [SAR202 cluster bacterium]